MIVLECLAVFAVFIIAGTCVTLLAGYITYFNPSDDFRKLVKRIRHRSWERDPV